MAKKIFVTTRFLISLTNFSGSQIKAQLQYIYIFIFKYWIDTYLIFVILITAELRVTTVLPILEVLKRYLKDDPRCLELFARNLWPNWTSWGNEVCTSWPVKQLFIFFFLKKEVDCLHMPILLHIVGYPMTPLHYRCNESSAAGSSFMILMSNPCIYLFA